MISTIIKDCSEEDFETVKKLICKFELDDRQLEQQQFLTLYSGKELAGFGRVREYNGFSEMCSTGIIEHYRNKGFGTMILKALEKKATQKIYLVCIIPAYFKKLGFEVCNSYPPEIADKLAYCITGLPVEEQYVVMTKSIFE